MGKKKLIIFLFVFIALSAVLYTQMGINVVAVAKDCDDEKKPLQTPTAPSEADYSEINKGILVINASDDQIAPGGSIILYVDSEGLACPDYTWSVSSSKYTLDKTETKNDLETVTLTADSGACGSGYTSSNVYVTVNVTDECGMANHVTILNTTGGWRNITTICSMGSGTMVANTGITGDTVGIYQYIFYPVVMRPYILPPGGIDCEPPFVDWNSCAELMMDGEHGFPNSNGYYIYETPPRPNDCWVGQNETGKVGEARITGPTYYIKAGGESLLRRRTWSCQ